jgi:hypothetical protein
MFDCTDAPVEALKEGRLLVMVANAVPCEVSAVHGRHARAQLERLKIVRGSAGLFSFPNNACSALVSLETCQMRTVHATSHRTHRSGCAPTDEWKLSPVPVSAAAN